MVLLGHLLYSLTLCKNNTFMFKLRLSFAMATFTFVFSLNLLLCHKFQCTQPFFRPKSKLSLFYGASESVLFLPNQHLWGREPTWTTVSTLWAVTPYSYVLALLSGNLSSSHRQLYCSSFSHVIFDDVCPPIHLLSLLGSQSRLGSALPSPHCVSCQAGLWAWVSQLLSSSNTQWSGRY